MGAYGQSEVRGFGVVTPGVFQQTGTDGHPHLVKRRTVLDLISAANAVSAHRKPTARDVEIGDRGSWGRPERDHRRSLRLHPI